MTSALIELLKKWGIRWSMSFSWTGYTKPMAKDLYLLLDAIHLPLCRPEYQPGNGVTHCNQYVNDVCQEFGCKDFDGMTANQMFALMVSSPAWSQIAMDKAQSLANEGTLVIAGLSDDPHGHVNVICPGREKTSGRWGSVPSAANVGKDVFIGRGINWAFSDLPRFFAWRQSL